MSRGKWYSTLIIGTIAQAIGMEMCMHDHEFLGAFLVGSVTTYWAFKASTILVIFVGEKHGS